MALADLRGVVGGRPVLPAVVRAPGAARAQQRACMCSSPLISTRQSMSRSSIGLSHIAR